MSDRSSSLSCYGSLRRTFCCLSDCGVSSVTSEEATASTFEGKGPGPPMSVTSLVVTSPVTSLESVVTSPVTSLEPVVTSPVSMQSEDAAKAEEELVVPSWVDQKFIETALRTKHPELTVTSLRVEAAVAKGENYACVVFRAVANTSQGQHSVFLKCIPNFPGSEGLTNFIRTSGIMAREMRMYAETLPMLRANSSKPNYPECLYVVQDNERETLVLEDLRSSGYRTYPRKLGLDLPHCRLAITELAHLHGPSIALRIKDPVKFKTEIQDKYEESGYTEENRKMLSPILSNPISPLAAAIKRNLPFRFHEIANIYKEMGETSYTDIMNILKLPETGEELSKKIISLTHGDFWSNNMLFQYKEGSAEPLACSIVDFQITRCAPPVLDLLYFFYTSTTQVTRRAHMDELLQLYLDEARAAMRERGVTDPGTMFYRDVAEVRREMQQYAIFGLLMSMFVMPVVVAEAGDVPDFEDMTSEEQTAEEHFIKMYSGKLFCQRMIELLEDFDDMGLFAEQSKRQEKANINSGS